MSTSSCIITLIKNEHLYLSEWIKYHLDLGVEHIFVFEDVGSDTHKDITDAFGDKVTLNGIFSILDEESREKALELKSTMKSNVQHLYMRNALMYVKNYFQDKYDWCFVIDADEFLTLEKDSLENVLSLYRNYDAFIMLWKCYGANGLVSKPDYTKKGVIETYTKEAPEGVFYNPQYRVKTCFNLKRYEFGYYLNAHQPSEECVWCNTSLHRNIISTYAHIYIRHYITKSWEEYVWKRTTRGYLWGKKRFFDLFFLLNPELNPIKKQLLKNVRKQNFGYPAV